MISHSNKDYSENILNSIRKQLRLDTKEQLLDLINCPLSEKDYRKIVNEKVNSKLL